MDDVEIIKIIIGKKRKVLLKNLNKCFIVIIIVIYICMINQSLKN